MAALPKIVLVLLFALIFCFGVEGSGWGGSHGSFRGDHGNGNQQGFGGGRSLSGGSDKKYRSTPYFDDDVYGYEANYPGGDVMFINYRTSEARSRRGQQFARSSPYSSGGSQGSSWKQRQSGDMGHGGGGFGQW